MLRGSSLKPSFLLRFYKIPTGVAFIILKKTFLSVLKKFISVAIFLCAQRFLYLMKHMQRETCTFPSNPDTLSNESMAFPVNTLCFLQSLHASQQPIKAIDLLRSARSSSTLQSDCIPRLYSLARSALWPSVLTAPPFI